MSDKINVTKVTAAPDLSGSTALVTGAGKGLGRASALALAEAGARVIGVSRTETDLQELQSHYPDQIEYWTEDVLEEALYKRIEKLSKLDIFVACAGANRPKPITDLTSEDITWLMNLNVEAVFKGAQSATRVMETNSNGKIVFMSSQMGMFLKPSSFTTINVLSIIKYFARLLTESLAKNLCTSKLGLSLRTIIRSISDIEGALTVPNS